MTKRVAPSTRPRHRRKRLRGYAASRMKTASDTGGLDLREHEPRDPEDDHVDLARGIALGIVVGIVMWALAALIVWAMWR